MAVVMSNIFSTSRELVKINNYFYYREKFMEAEPLTLEFARSFMSKFNSHVHKVSKADYFIYNVQIILILSSKM